MVNQEPFIDKAESVILSEAAPNIGAENFPLLLTKLTDSIINVEGSVFSPEQKDLKFCKEKALFKESESIRIEEEKGLTGRAEAGGTLQAGPSEDKTKSASLSEPSDSLLKSKKPIEKKFPNVKETAKIEKEKKMIQADTKFSSSRVVIISKAQTTAPAKKENGPVAKVEEEQQPKIVVSAVSAQKETPSTPGQQETISPEDKQTLDTQVNEDTAIKLQHIDSNVAQLTRSVAASDETNRL